MTVRELIEKLEEIPRDYRVTADNIEITEIVVRNEMYLDEDGFYKDGFIVKLY